MRSKILFVMLVAACHAGDAAPDLEAAQQAIEDPDDPPTPRSGPINPLPNGLHVETNYGGRTIMIRWNCGGNAEQQLSKIQKNGGPWLPGDQSCNISQTAGVDSVPVAPNTPYCFKAYAQNTTHVAETQPFCVTSDRYREDPLPPAHEAMTAKSDRIELRFRDRSDIESGFRIYRAIGANPPISAYTVRAELGPLSGTGRLLAWDDREFEPNKKHWYRIEVWHPWAAAIDANYVIDAWPSAPAAPTVPTFGLVSGDRVRFEWHDNSSNEEEFHVHADHENGDHMFKLVGRNTTSATFDEDDGLHEGLWTFRVRSANREANSSYAFAAVNVPAPSDDDGGGGGGGGSGTLYVCGAGCPSGYHVERYSFDASCAQGPPNNLSTCVPDSGTFSSCSVGCPSGWHPTSHQYNAQCVWVIGSLDDNQSTCQTNTNDFWSCDLCPGGYMLTDTVATTSCFFGTKYHCHK